MKKIKFQNERINKSSEGRNWILGKFLLVQIVIGLILIAPALVGSVFFLLSVFGYNGLYEASLNNLSSKWTGENMSAAPIFMGLMALAGVYLLNNVSKNLIYGSNPDVLIEYLDNVEVKIEDSEAKDENEKEPD